MSEAGFRMSQTTYLVPIEDLQLQVVIYTRLHGSIERFVPFRRKCLLLDFRLEDAFALEAEDDIWIAFAVAVRRSDILTVYQLHAKVTHICVNDKLRKRHGDPARQGLLFTDSLRSSIISRGIYLQATSILEDSAPLRDLISMIRGRS